MSQGATELSVIRPIQSVEGGTLRTRIGQNPMILIDHGFLLEYVAAPHRFDEDITPVLMRLALGKSLACCNEEASR